VDRPEGHCAALWGRAMNLRSAATFPCNENKKPITVHGFKDAVRGVEWRRAPLVGFPTGAVNGVDVLDIDGDAGRKWYDRNFDAIPATRAHSTRRGMHLLFVHAPGLRCSTGKIAEGVDVKAEDGYIIYWPREGLPVEDAPISAWPDWLLEEAREASKRKDGGKGEGQGGGTPSTLSYGFVGTGVEVADATEALRQLDPCAWAHRHDEWFALLMGAKAAGIGVEDFVEWSTGDAEYAGDAEIIRVKWNSVEPQHPGAFFKALKDAEIKLTRNKWRSAGGSTSPIPRPTFTPTIDVRGRTSRLCAWLATQRRPTITSSPWPRPSARSFWKSVSCAGWPMNCWKRPAKKMAFGNCSGRSAAGERSRTAFATLKRSSWENGNERPGHVLCRSLRGWRAEGFGQSSAYPSTKELGLPGRV
jgi:hypothetical protein